MDAPKEVPTPASFACINASLVVPRTAAVCSGSIGNFVWNDLDRDGPAGYSVLAFLTTVYARTVIRLDYETARIVKIIAGALGIYATSVLVGDNGPAVNLATSLSLVGLLPVVLWLLGFWTSAEKSRLTSVVRTAVRTRRDHHHGELGPIGHP